MLVSFNPCFIGTYSFTIISNPLASICLFSFNPCFIGTYSFTLQRLPSYRHYYFVLILVLLELILLHSDKLTELGVQYRFNPCFIGTYSFTHLLSFNALSNA